MRTRVSVLLASLGLAVVTAACATTAPSPDEGKARPPLATSFESWAVSNGTGAFFKPVGPARGSGVRSLWP